MSRNDAIFDLNIWTNTLIVNPLKISESKVWKINLSCKLFIGYFEIIEYLTGAQVNFISVDDSAWQREYIVMIDSEFLKKSIFVAENNLLRYTINIVNYWSNVWFLKILSLISMVIATKYSNQNDKVFFCTYSFSLAGWRGSVHIGTYAPMR